MGKVCSTKSVNRTAAADMRDRQRVARRISRFFGEIGEGDSPKTVLMHFRDGTAACHDRDSQHYLNGSFERIQRRDGYRSLTDQAGGLKQLKNPRPISRRLVPQQAAVAMPRDCCESPRPTRWCRARHAPN
jgi:hypothetical protein